MICSSDDNGFPAGARLDAVRYRYASKEEADVPFTINVFNSKKGGKSQITIEAESNTENSSLGFK
jgi:hypothetical protein